MAMMKISASFPPMEWTPLYVQLVHSDGELRRHESD